MNGHAAIPPPSAVGNPVIHMFQLLEVPFYALA